MARLDDLLAAYPWLRQLTPDVLARLDVDELADPPHPAAAALGPRVVAYRRGARPRPDRISLCSVVQAAQLDPERLSRLAAAEHQAPDVVLVEYEVSG